MNYEEWRPIAGLPLYEVSNQGRVRATGLSLRGERIRRQTVKKNGYCMVNLWDREAQKYTYPLVHRLVLQAFVGNAPQSGMHARHLNGQRTDNRLENLAWATPKENEADKLAHGTKLLGTRTNSVKLTEEQVRIIKRARSEAAGRKWGGCSLAREFGVSRTTVDRIANGKYWLHVRP